MQSHYLQQHKEIPCHYYICVCVCVLCECVKRAYICVSLKCAMLFFQRDGALAHKLLKQCSMNVLIIWFNILALGLGGVVGTYFSCYFLSLVLLSFFWTNATARYIFDFYWLQWFPHRGVLSLTTRLVVFGALLLIKLLTYYSFTL